ncbi:unnamed protein product [Cylicocyclus nassatus]|uniref:Cytochrome-b5 reductase n=1 Tax=Cylicocyclus nassatus TaxID=53992 RepID=A0AA36DVF1_CYLNA|nr:unnamed protein product [Cylicocyclus nassatus]
MPFLGLPNLTARPAVGRSEYGRVKVALPPGKGLMDWVRLASEKILAKKHMSVTSEELVKHNTRDDCWVHIFGQVYDVTSYLEFHPGGIPELMRAAGTDGTALFNQYHAWVNYESMLKSCLVGRFVGDLSKLPQPGPSTLDEQPTSVSAQLNALIMKEKQSKETYGVNIEKDDRSVTLTCPRWKSSDLHLDNVVVEFSASKRCLRIVVRPAGSAAVEVKWEEISTEVSLNGYQVSVDKQPCIKVSFDADDLNVAAVLSTACQSVKQSPLLTYHECSIEGKLPISHDTLLFTVSLPTGVFSPVPVGRHVSFKIKKGSSVIYRSYTPVSLGSLPQESNKNSAYVLFSSPSKLIFLIKIYADGICTPLLEKLLIGGKIEMSEPVGSKDLSKWIDADTELLMLAAGTGLTPMVNVIRARLKSISERDSNKCNTTLLLFNKTEKDIVDDDWLPMKWDDSRIRVEHILSEPSEKWTGRMGRISAAMLPVPHDSLRVLLCGPDGFIENAVQLLNNANYKSDNIHIFQG